MKNFILKLIQFINDKLEAAHQQHRMIQQECYDKYIFNFMLEIALSLSIVFAGNQYHGLSAINEQSDVRPVQYKKINNKTIYYFSLQRNRLDNLDKPSLIRLIRKMNKDIQYTQVSLCNYINPEYEAIKYPFLFNDLCIVDAYEQDYTLIIGVVTAIIP